MSDRHKGYARSQAWKRLRRAVFARADYRCEVCGQAGQRLECDHKLPLHKGGTHDIQNLRAICRACHIAATRREVRTHHVKGQAEWEFAMTKRREFLA